MSFKLVIFLFLASSSVAIAGKSPHGEELYDLLKSYGYNKNNIDEDAYLDVPGLITKYGYQAESHEVETEDGYLLTMHRIAGKQGEVVRENKPVVFLMHGLLSSSADWINAGPHNDALGYLLADEGYDVWMGNARANHYSRKHNTMDPESSNFWKFSWHEIGVYDLPAMIDYALEISGQKKLFYIGHSQGTTAFFVLTSEKPAYNNKIHQMHALAPVAYMSNLQNPVVRLLAQYTSSLEILLQLLGRNSVGSNREFFDMIGETMCKNGNFLQPICKNVLFILAGFNSELFNSTLIPTILGHTPAGAASKQVIHYLQEFESAKFRQYDYGTVLNYVKYKQATPPEYNLSLITAPVALHYSLNDWLSHKTDVEQLDNELGASLGMYEVPNPRFNHIDFLWAIGVKSLLYDQVIGLMNQVV